MTPQPPEIPQSLRYRDGLYRLERFPRAGAVTSVRTKRRLTRTLRSVHRPWFALWMPTGVAALTTTGRRSGKPRTTFVRAYPDDAKVYLISISGEHALWLKNIRANPSVILRFRSHTVHGMARNVASEAERRAIEWSFCSRTLPFDYAENMFHRTGWPTRTKIAELHRAWLEGGSALVVDLAQPDRKATL